MARHTQDEFELKDGGIVLYRRSDVTKPVWQSVLSLTALCVGAGLLEIMCQRLRQRVLTKFVALVSPMSRSREFFVLRNSEWKTPRTTTTTTACTRTVFGGLFTRFITGLLSGSRVIEPKLEGWQIDSIKIYRRNLGEVDAASCEFRQ